MISRSIHIVIAGAQLSEQRRLEIIMLTPLPGSVAGPIAGGFIAENTTWRWVFWSTSIVGGLVQTRGLLWLQESHEPTLLERSETA